MEQYKWLCFIVIAVGIYKDAVAEKPMIIPKKDQLEIREGTELKIDCYSKGSSVHFSFPNYTFMSPRSRYNITTAKNGTSTFLRKNTVSLDTGWYACAAKGVKIENHFKILNRTQKDVAWIYIYVNSSEPFADRYYTFPKSIIVSNGSSAIVPCRPTSPRLKIQLWQNFSIIEPNDKVRFDPKIGFVIDQLVFETLVIHFQCKINEVVDRYDLYYSRAGSQKPKLNESSEVLWLREGDKLRIVCDGGIRKRFFFPNKIPETSEYEIIDGDNETSTFLRHKTVSDDTGWYGCAEEGINMKISFVNYMEYTKTEIEWIYVYVDPGSFRFIRDSFFPEYSDESDVYFPCRMTSLECDHIREFETESVELNENVRFDSKFGFLVKEGLNDSARYYRWKIGTPNDNKTYFFYKPSKEVVRILTSPIRSIFFTGEDLHLPCVANIDSKENNTLQWYSPSTASETCPNYETSKYLDNDKLDSYYVINILSKRKLKKSDSGEYSCSFDGIIKQKVVVSVFGREDTDYRKLDLQKNEYKLVRWENENAKWIVDLQGFLVEGVLWTRPSNETIEHAVSIDSSRREFHFTDRFWDLMEIHNLTLNDSGVYRIQINTSVGMISFNFALSVQALPNIYVENGTLPYYATRGEVFHVYCCTSGSPKPTITWEFSRRPYFPYENDSELTVYSMHAFDFSNEKFVCSNLKMSTNMSGILTCTACNSISCAASTTKILFSDRVRRFGIIPPEERFFYGDDITLTCSGSIHDFRKLSWKKNFDECYYTENLSKMYKNHKTRFTENAILHLTNVTTCHRRLYSCLGQTLSGTIEPFSHYLNLSAPQKPYFTNTNLNKSRITWNPKSEDSKTILLICCADGDPRPEVTWFENNRRVYNSPEYRISPETCELLTTLDFQYSNSLRYTCSARNRFGRIEDYVDHQIEDTIQTVENDQRQLDKSLLFPNIFLIIFLVGLIIAWVILRKRRIKRTREKFKRAILERFNEGAWNYVQPYIRIADQAEVLPYDVKWEYPRRLLKFDKILGSGAFGIVRKAEAKSICPGKAVSTVAVKMVRATHRLHYMTALTRELKVLVHLGGHLNIVNLLGACTQNVSYGELLVIVEFCRFGNLHDYLFRGRDNFIDELDPETEEIIGPNLEMDCIDIEHNSCCSTDFVANNMNTNDEALKNGLVQPGLRCHYRGDEPDLIVESICMKDLLCWAWQVTRGMRYLGRRKVVHGDLAARNILLADNNVIKICDFGLAEILYKDDDYRKLGDDPLPLQWMAIESIKDRVFSIESDIWSFGIVLWEFFTLAETPYRGTSPRNLYQKLSTGYRMSRPKYAPENIHRIMMKCWEAEPAERPSFLKLETDIALLLDDGICTYYMDMDPPYTDLNKDTVETENIDFLTMDPSEMTAVSFSSGQEKVKLCNVPLDRSSCPSHPGPSAQDICSVSVSMEN